MNRARARFRVFRRAAGCRLALQVFYPDYFNGTWTFCPDPVDFRAFELVNIYEDDNAYVNKFGNERPSERTLNGDTRSLMRRRKLQIENVTGTGDSWTMSGKPMVTWNATYGPRAANGKPSVLWAPGHGQDRSSCRRRMEENGSAAG